MRKSLAVLLVASVSLLPRDLASQDFPAQNSYAGEFTGNLNTLTGLKWGDDKQAYMELKEQLSSSGPLFIKPIHPGASDQERGNMIVIALFAGNTAGYSNAELSQSFYLPSRSGIFELAFHSNDRFQKLKDASPPRIAFSGEVDAQGRFQIPLVWTYLGQGSIEKIDERYPHLSKTVLWLGSVQGNYDRRGFGGIAPTGSVSGKIENGVAKGTWEIALVPEKARFYGSNTRASGTFTASIAPLASARDVPDWVIAVGTGALAAAVLAAAAVIAGRKKPPKPTSKKQDPNRVIRYILNPSTDRLILTPGASAPLEVTVWAVTASGQKRVATDVAIQLSRRGAEVEDLTITPDHGKGSVQCQVRAGETPSIASAELIITASGGAGATGEATVSLELQPGLQLVVQVESIAP